MMHGAAVPIPARLARRPRDRRGYPVPYTVALDASGVPQFAVTDIERWMHAARFRKCALCGEPMGSRVAFVGGELCHINRLFTDLPMHRDCAVYALQVCPYIALPRTVYARAPQVPEGYGGMHVAPSVSVGKPARFMLGITADYEAVILPGGSYGVRAAPWLEVQWWKDGEPLQEGSEPCKCV